MLCRLRRWSIFDSDAMPMFFYINDAMSTVLAISYHRNRCDYFWSTIRTDFFRWFFQFTDRCLAMIFFCENLKTAYFTTCSNWRQFVRIGGHHLRKYRIYENASGGNSGILWDGLIIHTSIKHTWMLALRQASGGVYLEQFYSPTL